LYFTHYEKPLKELSETEGKYKKTLEIHSAELLEFREALSKKTNPSKLDLDKIYEIDEDMKVIAVINDIFENKIVERIVHDFVSKSAILSGIKQRNEITPTLELDITKANEYIKALQVKFAKYHFPYIHLNNLIGGGEFATLARTGGLEYNLQSSTLNRETLLREGNDLLSIYANISSILRTDLGLPS